MPRSHRHNNQPRLPQRVDKIRDRIATDTSTSERDARVARREAYEKAAADPRNQVDPSPEVVRARVRRTAVVPGALTVPCLVHAVQAGTPCFAVARGVCAERVKRRAATR